MLRENVLLGCRFYLPRTKTNVVLKLGRFCLLRSNGGARTKTNVVLKPKEQILNSIVDLARTKTNVVLKQEARNLCSGV